MGRSERRFRTSCVQRNRFRSLYCNYGGTIEPHFLEWSTPEDWLRRYGECRNRADFWTHDDRFENVLRFRRMVADQNFYESFDESLQAGVEVKSCHPRHPRTLSYRVQARYPR